MDPAKLQQFTDAALKAGFAPKDVNDYIEQQTKTQQILNAVKQGLTPQDVELQQDLKKVGATKNLTNELDEQQEKKSKREKIDSAVSAVKSGSLYLDDISADIRTDVANELTSQGASLNKKGKDLSEGERTKLNLAKTGLQSAKTLSDIYTKDPDILKKQLLPGKLASRSFDSALFATVDTLLRIRTGATAPEEEIRRYMAAYGPQFGDSPEDVTFKLNNLTQALISEGGVSEGEVKKLLPNGLPTAGLAGKSQPQPPPPSGNVLMDLLQKGQQGAVAASRPEPNILGDLLLGRSAAAQRKTNAGENVSLDEKIGVAGETAMLALPWAKLGLLGKAGLAGRGAATGAVYGATTPGASAGERATGGLVGGALGGILGGAGQVGGRIKQGLDLKNLGQQRKAAVEASKNLKVSGNDILTAGKEYIRHDPLAQNVFKKIEPTLKNKQILLPDLMKKIDVWNDAYTQAGRVGKSAEAGINNVLARAAKDLLPESVSKVNQGFARAYNTRGTIKKYGPEIIKGVAGGGLLGVVLARMLGGRD